MSLTTTSLMTEELQKSLAKKFRCDLLHKKYPIYDAKTHQIYYYCKECQHDNDSSKN